MRASFLRLFSVYAAALAATTQSTSLRAAETRRASVPVAAYVREAAQRFAVPEAWIYAVMRVESAGNPRAISLKGATGLMQIMPVTWTYLRARYGLGDNIFDPRANILAGAAYMRELYDRYGAPGFLAAYNAGQLRYQAYLQTGRPLPAETVTYLAKLSPITGGIFTPIESASRLDPLAWKHAGIFASRSGYAAVARGTNPVSKAPIPADVAPARTDSTRPTLFVALSGQHPQ